VRKLPLPVPFLAGGMGLRKITKSDPRGASSSGTVVLWPPCWLKATASRISPLNGSHSSGCLPWTRNVQVAFAPSSLLLLTK